MIKSDFVNTGGDFSDEIPLSDVGDRNGRNKFFWNLFATNKRLKLKTMCFYERYVYTFERTAWSKVKVCKIDHSNHPNNGNDH